MTTMHDKAPKPAPRGWALETLDELRGMIPDIRGDERGPDIDVLMETLDRISAEFADDHDALAEISELLFLPDVTAYGARATAVFSMWDTPGQRAPSLAAFWAHAVQRFDLDLTPAMMQVAMMACVLAEAPIHLDYHDNMHFRKVMAHMVRLISTYQMERDEGDPVLTRDDIFKVLVAATIHDIGHEGGDNLRDGIYTPGYMEQKAFDILRPYADAMGMDRDMRGDIETLVFCTDITFFAGDNSPCVRMKKIYRYFFTRDLDAGEDIESMMIGKLRRFEDNPVLSMIAMMLHEADIATSAGLSYEQSQIETIKIMRERQFETAGPGVLLKFMIEQMGGILYSPAAKIIFQDRMNIIIDQAKEDFANGLGFSA